MASPVVSRNVKVFCNDTLILWAQTPPVGRTKLFDLIYVILYDKIILPYTYDSPEVDNYLSWQELSYLSLGQI